MSSSETIASRLAFAAARAPIYKASPAAFGATAAAADGYDTAYKNAALAVEAAGLIRAQAKAATDAQNTALRVMAEKQNTLLRTIKAFADSQPTPAARNAVLEAALLPLPTPPGPLPAPETPTDTTADPNANGTVTIRWKAKNNAGSIYMVYRKLAGNTTFTQIGFSSKKSFVDGTVPAGTTSCQYQIQAVRGQQTSVASQPVSVQFGAGGAVGYQGNLGLAA